MLSRVGKGEDDGPVVEPGHRLDDRAGERLAHRADAQDGRRLDGLDTGDEIPARGVRMRVGLLKVEKGLAAGVQQAIDVKHRNALMRLLERKAFLHHGGGDQAGQPDGGGTGAKEQDSLITNSAAGDSERGEKTGERHAASALNVVVVATNPITVAG